MPVMDGFEALVALRRDPLLAHIPVMMMTALRHHDHVLRLTANCTAVQRHVGIPVDPEGLGNAGTRGR
jgi:CheY-like chemotaxis protein